MQKQQSELNCRNSFFRFMEVVMCCNVLKHSGYFKQLVELLVSFIIKSKQFNNKRRSLDPNF